MAAGGAAAGAGVAADRARLPASPRGGSPPAASRPADRRQGRRGRRGRCYRRRRDGRRLRSARRRRARGDPSQRGLCSAHRSSRTAGCTPALPPRRGYLPASSQNRHRRHRLAHSLQRTAHGPPPTALSPQPSRRRRARTVQVKYNASSGQRLLKPHRDGAPPTQPRATYRNLPQPRATSRPSYC